MFVLMSSMYCVDMLYKLCLNHEVNRCFASFVRSCFYMCMYIKDDYNKPDFNYDVFCAFLLALSHTNYPCNRLD